MLKVAQLILILSPLCQCQFFCGEFDHPAKKPKVTVANSTHLNVSWHGLFTGCTSYAIESTTVEIEHETADATDTSQTFTADFETKEALVELNPCLGYRIYIRIHSNDGVSQRDSTIIKYNDMARQNIAQFYGGLLKKEYIKQICLKKVGPHNGMIWIPNPPKAVSKCILTTGDQDNDEFKAPGQSHFVPLKVLNPIDKQPMEITAMVNNIEMCPQTTTPTNMQDTTSPSNPIPMLGGAQSVIIFTSSILGTIVAVALITALVYRLKKRKRTVVRQEEDVNPVYGDVYYHLDRYHGIQKQYFSSYF